MRKYFELTDKGKDLLDETNKLKATKEGKKKMSDMNKIAETFPKYTGVEFVDVDEFVEASKFRNIKSLSYMLELGLLYIIQK